MTILKLHQDPAFNELFHVVAGGTIGHTKEVPRLGNSDPKEREEVCVWVDDEERCVRATDLLYRGARLITLGAFPSGF